MSSFDEGYPLQSHPAIARVSAYLMIFLNRIKFSIANPKTNIHSPLSSAAGELQGASTFGLIGCCGKIPIHLFLMKVWNIQ